MRYYLKESMDLLKESNYSNYLKLKKIITIFEFYKTINDNDLKTIQVKKDISKNIFYDMVKINYDAKKDMIYNFNFITKIISYDMKKHGYIKEKNLF